MDAPDPQCAFAGRVAAMSLKIIGTLATDQEDIGVKIAALRAAADTLTHAVGQQAASLALYRALNPGK